ncbi:MAG: hypothetical protein AMXMBFR7_31930 [Planctomycetota bacterium]
MLNHVAILVPSVHRCAQRLAALGHHVGEIEAQPADGSKEVYVGPPEAEGALLLVEPVGPGPFERAQRKRGFGLHHVAIDVDDPAQYAVEMGKSGWLLHPKSIAYFALNKTLFLARPGVCTLVEVQAKRAMSGLAQKFVTGVGIRCAPESMHLVHALGEPELHAVQGEAALEICGHPLALDLLSK